MRVAETELIGGEGLIYLATRVSKKYGGPEEIAEELKDEERVKRLLHKVIEAGHHSVMEHSLFRLEVDADWDEVAKALFPFKYAEASFVDGRIIVSFNPRTALEMLSDTKAMELAVNALRLTPMIAEAAGLSSDERPRLEVRMERVSNTPLVYRFVVDHHPDPRHGFAAFWAEMSRVASHQLVRHRRLSFTQRSGRYVRAKGFILPDVPEEAKQLMEEHASRSLELYERLIEMGLRREDARYILPAAIVTAVFISGREEDWLHFLRLRTDIHAQEEIRRIALVVAKEMGFKV